MTAPALELPRIEAPTATPAAADEIRATVATARKRRAPKPIEAPPAPAIAPAPKPASRAEIPASSPPLATSGPISGTPTRRKKKSGWQREIEKRQRGRAAAGAGELTGDGFREAQRAHAQRQGAAAAAAIGEQRRAEFLQGDGVRNLATSLGGIAAAVFGLVARHQGEHWRLSAQEAQALGDSGAQAIGPHVAANASEWMPWVFFGGCMFAVIEPRQAMDDKKKRVGTGAASPDHAAQEQAPASAPNNNGRRGVVIGGLQ